MKRPNKNHLKRAAGYFVALLAFLFITNPALIPFTSEKFRSETSGIWEKLFGDVEQVSALFTVNWATVFKLAAMILLLLVISNLARYILARVKPTTGQGKSALSMSSNGLSYLIVIVGIIWGLSIIGVNVTAIFAGVGVLALIVSFSAESLIEDVIVGLFLVFDKQFNVGDIIEIDGFRGTVEQIGVRSTYIKNVSGNVLIVNNSSIKKVLNRSVDISTVSCDVSIAYGANLEEAEKVVLKTLAEIKQKYPDVFPTDLRYSGVQDLSDSAVILRMTADVREEEIYRAPRLIRREMKLAFDKNGVEIPFPQVVVHEAK